MIFGSEPPLYLRPVGRRGLRRHEADVLQHPPGYAHPLRLLPPTGLPPPPPPAGPPYAVYATSPIFISEPHRLHPTLTAAAELQHARREEASQRDRWIQARRRRHIERVTQLEKDREEEFQQAQERSAQIAGISLRNEPGDGRDTVTRAFRTKEAQQQWENRRALEQHRYFSRQQKLMQHGNPHGYNILTGEPLHSAVVPLLPQPLPPVNNV